MWGRQRVIRQRGITHSERAAVSHPFSTFTGHYVSLIKSHSNCWLFFDDESVDGITESQIQTTFGSTQEFGTGNMDHG